MPIAQGVAKLLTFKKEASLAVAPTNDSSAKMLRRVTSDLGVDKNTFQSAEINPTYQIADFRHGGRRVTGTINGELSPGTWQWAIQSALRRDMTAIADLTAVSITVAGAGPTFTITRGSGDWTVSALRVGMVVRVTAGLANAANINKNLLIVAMTTTILTVIPLNGVAMVAEGPTSSTVNIPGRHTYTPDTGHTNDSYSIEQWFADITQNELYRGCRIGSVDLNLPNEGMSTISVGVLGMDVTTNTSRYFTSASAATTTGVIAANTGVVRLAGGTSLVVRGASININGNASVESVVGSLYSPDVFMGRVVVTGQINVFFENATMRDAFLNETEVELILALAAGGNANSDFMSFIMPRVKVGGARSNDGETGLSLTMPFQALYNGGGTGATKTTLCVQDSAAAA